MTNEIFDVLFVLSCLLNVVFFVVALLFFMQSKMRGIQIDALKDGVDKDSHAYSTIMSQRDQIKYLEEKVRDLNRQIEQGRCKDLWSTDDDKEDDLPVLVEDKAKTVMMTYNGIEMFDNKALLAEVEDDTISVHEQSQVLNAKPMEKSNQYVRVAEIGNEDRYVYVGGDRDE